MFKVFFDSYVNINGESNISQKNGESNFLYFIILIVETISIIFSNNEENVID